MLIFICCFFFLNPFLHFFVFKSQAEQTEKQIKEEFEKLHQFLRDEEEVRRAALREEEELKKGILEIWIEQELQILSDRLMDVEKEMENDTATFLSVINELIDDQCLYFQFKVQFQAESAHL